MHNADPDNATSGTKRSLVPVLAQLEQLHGKPAAASIWQQISQLVARTLGAMATASPHCLLQQIKVGINGNVATRVRVARLRARRNVTRSFSAAANSSSKKPNRPKWQH